MNWAFFDAFLENALFPMYGIVLVLALWKYSYYFETPLKFYPVLLFYTFLNEILGAAVKNHQEFLLVTDEFYRSYNWVIFNVYAVVFYLYFFYIFWKFIHKKSYKKWIVYGAVILMVTALINPFFQNILVPQVYTYTIGGLLLLGCIVLYLLDAGLKALALSHKLMLWVCAGLFIFYSGYLPIKVLRFYHSIKGIHEGPIVRRIHLSLIIIMYLCIGIGFLRMRKNRRGSTATI